MTILAGALTLLIAAASVHAFQDEKPTSADAALPPELVELVAAHNRERAAEKLPPLVANAKLSAAALVHARDMAEHNKMTHDGSDGSKFDERIGRQGYQGRKMGENIAYGHRTIAGVMREWMDSPPHREHILGAFTEIGVAYATSEDGTRYWCTEFGVPRTHLERDDATAGLVTAVNRARADVKKPPLKVSLRLSKAAQDVAQELAALGDLQKGEKTYFDRARAAGYRYRFMGQAAASGQATPGDVVRDWLQESIHRDNLLGKFSDIGVGYAISQTGVPFWMVFVAQPMK
jgi:uncharacterized protein YkwD